MSVGTLQANPERNGDDSLTSPIGSNSPLWHYRHLFGDQPLLLPRRPSIRIRVPVETWEEPDWSGIHRDRTTTVAGIREDHGMRTTR